MVNFFGHHWMSGSRIVLTFINGGVQQGDRITCRGVLHNPLSTTDTVTSGWHSDSFNCRQQQMLGGTPGVAGAIEIER